MSSLVYSTRIDLDGGSYIVTRARAIEVRKLIDHAVESEDDWLPLSLAFSKGDSEQVAFVRPSRVVAVWEMHPTNSNPTNVLGKQYVEDVARAARDLGLDGYDAGER